MNLKVEKMTILVVLSCCLVIVRWVHVWSSGYKRSRYIHYDVSKKNSQKVKKKIIQKPIKILNKIIIKQNYQANFFRFHVDTNIFPRLDFQNVLG